MQCSLSCRTWQLTYRQLEVRVAESARYTYRLRMSASAKSALLAEWDRCRWVWNECVVQSRDAHCARRECGPAMLDVMLTGWRAKYEWLRAGASVPQQQTIRDFGRSRTKALKDIRSRLPVPKRAGMPRFKQKYRAAPTLNYTRRGFRLDGANLCLAQEIIVRPVWSRRLPSHPSSVRIFRDSLGHWYASFVVACTPQALPRTGAAIGVDWGVINVATTTTTTTTTSDAHDLSHPEYGRTQAARLGRYQRMMARRRGGRGVPATTGYCEARRLAARAYNRAKHQRRDRARKWAKAVVRDFDRIAVEDFRPRFLTKTTMARKAADAAIGITKAALIEAGRKHDRLIVLVDAKYTSMDCGHCGVRTTHRLPLSERTYTCDACGTVSDRDKNSARVMLVRAGFIPVGADRTSPCLSQSDTAA
jgi:putative transposase